MADLQLVETPGYCCMRLVPEQSWVGAAPMEGALLFLALNTAVASAALAADLWRTAGGPGDGLNDQQGCAAPSAEPSAHHQEQPRDAVAASAAQVIPVSHAIA